MDWEFSLADIQKVAREFWRGTPGKRVFAFHGGLGSGKTTFIHSLCDEKGVTDVVTSPTFSIINEYEFAENGVERMIYHIDLYRLKDEDEAKQAGVEDCIYSDHICLVEWPERAPGLFPTDTVHVYLEASGSETRVLRIMDN